MLGCLEDPLDGLDCASMVFAEHVRAGKLCLEADEHRVGRQVGELGDGRHQDRERPLVLPAGEERLRQRGRGAGDGDSGRQPRDGAASARPRYASAAS